MRVGPKLRAFVQGSRRGLCPTQSERSRHESEKTRTGFVVVGVEGLGERFGKMGLRGN